MATFTIGDLPTYDHLIRNGMMEAIAQNLDIFNAAGNNTLNIVPAQEMSGDFKKEMFVSSFEASAVRFRDPTSQASQTPTSISSGELIGVRTFQNCFIEVTNDTARESGAASIDEFAFMLGQGLYRAQRLAYLKLACSALVGVFKAASMSSAVFDTTGVGNGKLTVTALNEARKPLGDAQQVLRSILSRGIHSNNLLGAQITDKFPDLGMLTIYQGTHGTLGLPMIVSDESVLTDENTSSASTDDFDWVFQLVTNAITLEEVEGTRNLLVVPQAGRTNQSVEINLEWSTVVNARGMKWTGAGKPSTDAAIATGTNWALSAASIKNGPGVAIKAKA